MIKQMLKVIIVYPAISSLREVTFGCLHLKKGKKCIHFARLSSIHITTCRFELFYFKHKLKSKLTKVLVKYLQYFDTIKQLFTLQKR